MTSDTRKIGFIGVGLMGHGAAKNILEQGYALSILGHRKRAPVDDLVARGAKEAGSAAELAGESDVLILCLPSSVEVEAVDGCCGPTHSLDDESKDVARDAKLLPHAPA